VVGFHGIEDPLLNHAGSSLPNSRKAHYVKNVRLVNGQEKTLGLAEIPWCEKGGNYWRK
jgi:hypothetical protein